MSGQDLSMSSRGVVPERCTHESLPTPTNPGSTFPIATMPRAQQDGVHKGSGFSPKGPRNQKPELNYLDMIMAPPTWDPTGRLVKESALPITRGVSPASSGAEPPSEIPPPRVFSYGNQIARPSKAPVYVPGADIAYPPGPAPQLRVPTLATGQPSAPHALTWRTTSATTPSALGSNRTLSLVVPRRRPAISSENQKNAPAVFPTGYTRALVPSAGDRFLPMRAATGAKAHITEKDLARAMERGISASYGGSKDNPNNWPEDITDEENCCLWITGIPTGTTVAQLFDALLSLGPVGKVFSCVINPPDLEKNHAAAASKLVFWTHKAAQGLVDRRQFVCNGGRCKVTWNRLKISERSDKDRCMAAHEMARRRGVVDQYRNQNGAATYGVSLDTHLNQCLMRDGLTLERLIHDPYDYPGLLGSIAHKVSKTMTRVVFIMGPSENVNEKWLTDCFASRFRWENDRVLTHWVKCINGQMLSCIEWRFGSFRCQAQVAVKVLHLDFPELRLAWGLDPLETGVDSWRQPLGIQREPKEKAPAEAEPRSIRYCMFHGKPLPCSQCQKHPAVSKDLANAPILPVHPPLGAAVTQLTAHGPLRCFNGMRFHPTAVIDSDDILRPQPALPNLQTDLPSRIPSIQRPPSGRQLQAVFHDCPHLNSSPRSQSVAAPAPTSNSGFASVTNMDSPSGGVQFAAWQRTISHGFTPRRFELFNYRPGERK